MALGRGTETQAILSILQSCGNKHAGLTLLLPLHVLLVVSIGQMPQEAEGRKEITISTGQPPEDRAEQKGQIALGVGGRGGGGRTDPTQRVGRERPR